MTMARVLPGVLLVVLAGCSSNQPRHMPTVQDNTRQAMGLGTAELDPIMAREVKANLDTETSTYIYTGSTEVTAFTGSSLSFTTDMVIFPGGCTASGKACRFTVAPNATPAEIRFLLYTRTPGSTDWQIYTYGTSEVLPAGSCGTRTQVLSLQVASGFVRVNYTDAAGSSTCAAQFDSTVDDASLEYGLMAYPSWDATTTPSGSYAYGAMQVRGPIPGAPTP